mgnify:CR=1 FL=1
MAALDFGATNTSTSSLVSFVKRIGAGLMSMLVSMAHARARSAEMQYYMDMSDEQLAAKGLRRDEIARHVFRDMLI